MCGRYALLANSDLLVELFQLLHAPVLTPRYNLAPTQMAPVIIAGEEGRTATMMRWGLVPGWAADLSIGNRLVNARSETAATKPAFRGAWRRGRCVIPADGFYEWSGPKSARQPHYISAADGGMLAFAGLHERWRGPIEVTGLPVTPELAIDDDGQCTIESFTILTTAANAFMATLHDRMPVLLDAAAIDRWLAPNAGDADALTALMQPAPDDALRAHPVTPQMNRPAFDAPACIEPIEPDADGPATASSQLDLF